MQIFTRICLAVLTIVSPWLMRRSNERLTRAIGVCAAHPKDNNLWLLLLFHGNSVKECEYKMCFYRFSWHSSSALPFWNFNCRRPVLITPMFALLIIIIHNAKGERNYDDLFCKRQAFINYWSLDAYAFYTNSFQHDYCILLPLQCRCHCCPGCWKGVVCNRLIRLRTHKSYRCTAGRLVMRSRHRGRWNEYVYSYVDKRSPI